MGRRAYKTPCKFFRDNDQVDEVRWLEADPKAEDLDRECVITSLDSEPDAWLDYPVGEVADSPRTTTLAKAPAGSGLGHVCGSDEDFAQGGTFDEGLPPVRYGALGLPLCCSPTVRVRGGAGGGGRAVVVVDGLMPPPVPILARPTCFFWVGGEIAFPWSVEVTNIPQIQEEVVFGGLTVGQTYRITITGGAGQFVAMWNGVDCASMTLIIFFQPMPWEFDWVQVDGPLVQLRIAPCTGFPPWTCWIREV